MFPTIWSISGTESALMPRGARTVIESGIPINKGDNSKISVKYNVTIPKEVYEYSGRRNWQG